VIVFYRGEKNAALLKREAEKWQEEILDWFEVHTFHVLYRGFYKEQAID